jgi:uncharacterized protein YciI
MRMERKPMTLRSTFLVLALVLTAAALPLGATGLEPAKPPTTTALPMPTPPTLAAAPEELPPNMARYYVVLLRRSGKPAPPNIQAISDGHMANIRKLAAQHQLLLAGPFMDQSGTGSLAGLFVLSAASLEEAKKLTDSDPAVAAGRLTVEVVPWLGPKSLTRVLETEKEKP